MKKTNKLWLALLLTVLVAALLAVGFTAAAAEGETPEIVDSGEYTDSNSGGVITWSLNQSGTLTIGGTGTVNSSPAPWETYQESIQNVIMEEGITCIGSSAFSGYRNLQEVVFPESLQSVEYYAFYACSSLRSASFGTNLSSFNSGAFDGCSALTRYEVSESNPNYSTEAGVLFNEEKTVLVRYPSGKVDEDYTVPESVSVIGSEAFSGAGHLQGIGLSANITEIGRYAFAYSGLTGITVPEGITRIETCTFSSCENLQNVVLPEGVTYLGDSCFSDCKNLQHITLPESLTAIGQSAFKSCSSLTAVVIPKNVTSIGSRVFHECRTLSSLTVAPGNPTYHTEGNCLIITGRKRLIANAIPCEIPSDGSVTAIGDFCFWYYNRKSLTLPKSITSISSWSFWFSGISEVCYDGTVEEYKAIAGIKETLSLTKYRVHFTAFDEPQIIASGYCGGEGDGSNVMWTIDSEGLLTISGTGKMGPYVQGFFYYDSVRTGVIHEGVTTINTYAFSEYTPLTELTIPASVEIIADMAFYHNEGLKRINIPADSRLTTIGKGAFSSVWNLQEIFVPAGVTSIGANAIPTWTVICGYAGSAAETYALENGNTFIALCPSNHPNAQTLAAADATEAAHGHTAGVWCPDCETWLSGGEVIHNHLGEQTVIKPATDTEEGLVDIVCTVCGETIRYTASTTGPEPDENGNTEGGFWQRITGFFRGFIDWFLRLFKWFGKK